MESPKVTISPAQNSDITPFNTNTFDVGDALLDVYPNGLMIGGPGGSTGGATFVAHDVKKNKVIRNKVNLTNFIRSIIKK